MTKEEENKAVVHRLFEEVINTGNLALADEVMAVNFITHRAALATASALAASASSHPPVRQEVPSGRDAFKQGLVALRKAFPDWRNIIDDLVCEGDIVAGRWTATGTHLGEFLGIAPTGKQIHMVEAGIIRIVDGKFSEIWVVADELGMLHALGAVVFSPSGVSA